MHQKICPTHNAQFFAIKYHEKHAKFENQCSASAFVINSSMVVAKLITITRNSDHALDPK